MGLFNVVNDQAQFDAASNVSSDVYGAGIRFTQAGAARVTTTAGTFFNQGVPMSATGQVAIVDATAGLPAGTIYHNGLPINGDRVCVSRNPSVVYSSGLPFDSNGALVGAINFDLNFIGTNTLDPQVTFTRASSATFFDSAGVLQSATTNTPRLDYNPSTLAAQGLLIEEARTNSIRNNTMQGAVAGTPGTLPTNWSTFTSLTGLTREVVGTGTESGITYIDIRVSGTPSAAGVYNINFESVTQIVAANGQTWAGSFYYKLQAGSTTGFSAFASRITAQDSGGANLGGTSQTFTPTSAALNTQRITAIHTNTSASTAFVVGLLRLDLTGVAIDITLRIGLPQMELGAFATSVIPTTTTALTRAADVASVNTLSPWYNQTEGSVYVELQSLSPLTPAQSVALGKFPTAYLFEAGASDSNLLWYGTGAEVFISTTYNNVGAVPSGINKFAVSMAPTAGQSRSSLNGAAAVNRSGTLSGTATQLVLGGGSITPGNSVFNGWLRRFAYYPRALSAAELQAITA